MDGITGMEQGGGTGACLDEAQGEVEWVMNGCHYLKRNVTRERKLFTRSYSTESGDTC